MRSTYLSLWLLLLVGFVILVAVSLIPQDICIGAHALKKAPVKSVLLGDKDSVGGVSGYLDSVDSDNENLNTEPTGIETDSVPKSILIFGDSMSYNLALRLAAYAVQNGHTIHSINWDGSTTKKWAESDTLKYFLKRYDVDFVVVALGSNEAYTRNTDAQKQNVERLLDAIGDRPYVWIGPPELKGSTGKFEEMLASTCRPRTFFKSTGIPLKRRGDNIHPTKEASALWMDSVARWMPKSGYPILMDLPSDTIRKVNANVISWSNKKK